MWKKYQSEETMKRKVLKIVMLQLFALGIVQYAFSLPVGLNTIDGLSGSNNSSTSSTSSYRRAQLVIMPEDGQIFSISMYHKTGANGKNMILAIYDNGSDNSPNNRLAQTQSTQIAATTDWQTIPLTTPIYVKAKQRLWVAWIYQTNPGIRSFKTSGTNSELGYAGTTVSWSTTVDNMPTKFGLSSMTKTETFCIFASYSPSPSKLGAIRVTQWGATGPFGLLSPDYIKVLIQSNDIPANFFADSILKRSQIAGYNNIIQLVGPAIKDPSDPSKFIFYPDLPEPTSKPDQYYYFANAIIAAKKYGLNVIPMIYTCSQDFWWQVINTPGFLVPPSPPSAPTKALGLTTMCNHDTWTYNVKTSSWTSQPAWTCPMAPDPGDGSSLNRGFDFHYARLLQRLKKEYDWAYSQLKNTYPSMPSYLEYVHILIDENYWVDNSAGTAHLMIGENQTNPVDLTYISNRTNAGESSEEAYKHLYADCIYRRTKSVVDNLFPETRVMIWSNMFDPQQNGGYPFFKKSGGIVKLARNTPFNQNNHATWEVVDFAWNSYQRSFVQQKLIVMPWHYSTKFDQYLTDDPAITAKADYIPSLTYSYYSGRGGFDFIPNSAFDIWDNAISRDKNNDNIACTRNNIQDMRRFRDRAMGYGATYYPCCASSGDLSSCACGTTSQLRNVAFWDCSRTIYDQPKEYDILEYAWRFQNVQDDRRSIAGMR
jgi:hypothetical protein